MLKWINEIFNKVQQSSLYSRIFKNFSLSLGGSVISMGIRLINMSLLTKILTVAEYGKIQIVLSLCTFLIFFLDIKMEVVIYKYIPHFRKEGKTREITGLFWVSILYCFLLGSLVFSIVHFGANWLASDIYNNESLAILIRTYSWCVLISSFSTVCAALLRLHDYFKYLVIPETLASLTILLLIVITYYFKSALAIEEVIVFNIIGVMVAKVPALIKSVIIIKQKYKMAFSGAIQDIKLLKPYQKELHTLLFQTNIEGYLKLGANRGGLFLLGIFSTPTQVAYFTIAANLLMPLRTLKKNINTSVSPEIYNLFANAKYQQVKKVIIRLFKFSLGISSLALIGALLLAAPVFTIFTKPDYLEALPNFYIQFLVFFLSFSTIPLYVLCVATNKLKRRNLLMGLQILCILFTLFLGLDAVKLATAQLVGNILVVLFSDLAVYKSFNKQYINKDQLSTITP